MWEELDKKVTVEDIRALSEDGINRFREELRARETSLQNQQRVADAHADRLKAQTALLTRESVAQWEQKERVRAALESDERKLAEMKKHVSKHVLRKLPNIALLRQLLNNREAFETTMRRLVRERDTHLHRSMSRTSASSDEEDEEKSTGSSRGPTVLGKEFYDTAHQEATVACEVADAARDLGAHVGVIQRETSSVASVDTRRMLHYDSPEKREQGIELLRDRYRREQTHLLRLAVRALMDPTDNLGGNETPLQVPLLKARAEFRNLQHRIASDALCEISPATEEAFCDSIRQVCMQGCLVLDPFPLCNMSASHARCEGFVQRLFSEMKMPPRPEVKPVVVRKRKSIRKGLLALLKTLPGKIQQYQQECVLCVTVYVVLLQLYWWTCF
ncbi:MAG: hypothetical protein MHM6MM_001051 [Cercozoa sp. M6MM]